MSAPTSRRSTAWGRLVSPLQYLAIRHPLKIYFDLFYPLALSVVTMVLLFILPVHAQVLGDNGFLKGVRDLIGLFAAFYVVALAAVATFAREPLDQKMTGNPVTLGTRELTRREYVCFLFGYLAITSFGLFLCGVAAQIITPSLRVILPANWFWWARGALGFIFSFAFWNMTVVTLLGVYFLVERVHIGNAPSGHDINVPKQ